MRCSSSICRTRASASRTGADAWLRPCSSRMYMSVLICARLATSSRRSPLTRRRPPLSGSPTVAGLRAARRAFRKAPSSPGRAPLLITPTVIGAQVWSHSPVPGFFRTNYVRHCSGCRRSVAIGLRLDGSVKIASLPAKSVLRATPWSDRAVGVVGGKWTWAARLAVRTALTARHDGRTEGRSGTTADGIATRRRFPATGRPDGKSVAATRSTHVPSLLRRGVGGDRRSSALRSCAPAGVGA